MERLHTRHLLRGKNSADFYLSPHINGKFLLHFHWVFWFNDSVELFNQESFLDRSFSKWSLPHASEASWAIHLKMQIPRPRADLLNWESGHLSEFKCIPPRSRVIHRDSKAGDLLLCMITIIIPAFTLLTKTEQIRKLYVECMVILFIHLSLIHSIHSSTRSCPFFPNYIFTG